MAERCRSCNAEILWTVTTKGRRMPVDVKPSPEGNIRLVDQGKYRPPLAEYHTVRADGVEYHLSHFVTCPERDKWRKKK